MQYSPNELIYEGNHSLIYYRESDDGGAPVVLKVLKPDDPSPHQLVQFNTEYELTRDLNAPGIRRALKSTRVEGKSALELEFVAGITVKEMAARGAIPLDTFLKTAARMAQALGEVHQRRIIHKDITSHNILVHPETHEVTIIDFGLATRLTTRMPDESNPDTLEGTLAYISPEQTGRMNRVVDSRSDLYSLGVVFYEMITGRRLCNRLLTAPPDRLAALKAAILDAIGDNGRVLVDVIPRLELIIGPQPAGLAVGNRPDSGTAHHRQRGRADGHQNP